MVYIHIHTSCKHAQNARLQARPSIRASS